MAPTPFSLAMGRQLEEIEVLAWIDLYAAASPAVVEQLGLAILPLGSGCLSAVAKVDVLAMNRAFGFGLREPVDQSSLAPLIEEYRAAGSRRFFVQVSPYAMPADLHAWLTTEGFVPYNNWVKLYRTVEDFPNAKTDLTVERITEPGAFGEIAAAAFEWPKEVAPWIGSTVGRAGWHHYLAFDGKKPVATGAFFVEGEFAWLDLGSTLPEARGRGAQSALLYRRALDAAAQGCRWLTVETAEQTREKPAPSYRNMVRAGFRIAYSRPNYLYQFVTE